MHIASIRYVPRIFQLSQTLRLLGKLKVIYKNLYTVSISYIYAISKRLLAYMIYPRNAISILYFGTFLIKPLKVLRKPRFRVSFAKTHPETNDRILQIYQTNEISWSIVNFTPFGTTFGVKHGVVNNYFRFRPFFLFGVNRFFLHS